jgi:hypothetical protein
MVLALAALAVFLNAGFGLWVWFRESDPRALLWSLFWLVFWAFLELAQGPRDPRRRPIVHWHRIVIACIGFYCVAKIGLDSAFEAGLLAPDWKPLAVRGMGAVRGLLLAVWGNYLPKLLSPWSLEEEPFDWQRVHRFAGRLATIAGLVSALGWLALPFDWARTTTSAAVLSFCILAVGAKWSSLTAHRPSRPTTAL